jgi:hypothetical protein
MNLILFFKRNPLKFIGYGIFLSWIGFLIVLCFCVRYDPVFYDVLSQTDVSSEYIIQIPILRYFLEPIIGFSIIFGEQTDGIALLVVVGYLILRICIRYADQKQFHGQLENSSFFSEGFAILDFTFKVFLLSAIIGSAIMVIGTIIAGIMFGYGYYGLIYNIAIYIAIGGFVIRFIIGLMRLKYKKRVNRYKFGKPAQELLHFGEIFMIIMMGGFVSLAIPWPTQEIYINSPSTNDFLFDFHAHTYFSDGTLSPASRVQWYMEQGIDGAAITDHSSLSGALQAQAYVNATNLNFTVLIGQEYTSEDPAIHLNIYGIETLITPIHLIPPNPFIDLQGPNPMNVSDMIQWVKMNKGYVIVNHYLEDIPPPFTLEQLRDWGVDGFEIINEGCIYPDVIRQFCIDNNLIAIGGSDYHTNKPLNTFVKLHLDDPTNRSLDAIMAALRHNEHEVVTLDKNRQINTDIGLINEFFKYILGISPLQIGSWVVWSIFGFFGAIKYYHFVKKSILSINLESKNQQKVEDRSLNRN